MEYSARFEQRLAAPLSPTVSGCKQRRGSRCADHQPDQQRPKSEASRASRKSSTILSPRTILLLGIVSLICAAPHTIAQQTDDQAQQLTTTTATTTQTQTTTTQTSGDQPASNQQTVRQQSDNQHSNQFQLQQHQIEQGQVSDSDLLADIEAIDLQKDRQNELNQQSLNYNLNIEQQAQAKQHPQVPTTTNSNDQIQQQLEQQPDYNSGQQSDSSSKLADQQQAQRANSDIGGAANPYIRLSNIAIINSTSNGNSSASGASGGQEMKLMRIYVIDLDQKLVIGSGRGNNIAPASGPSQEPEAAGEQQQVAGLSQLVDSFGEQTSEHNSRDQPIVQQQSADGSTGESLSANNLDQQQQQSVAGDSQHQTIEQQQQPNNLITRSAAANHQPASTAHQQPQHQQPTNGTVSSPPSNYQPQQRQDAHGNGNNDYQQQEPVANPAQPPLASPQAVQEYHVQQQPANHVLDQSYVFVNKESLQANISDIADHELHSYQSQAASRGPANQTSASDHKQQQQRAVPVEYQLLPSANYSQQHYPPTDSAANNEQPAAAPHPQAPNQNNAYAAQHPQDYHSQSPVHSKPTSVYKKTHNSSQPHSHPPVAYVGNNQITVGYPHFVMQNQTPVAQVVATYPVAEQQQQYAGLVPQYISPQYKSDSGSVESLAKHYNNSDAQRPAATDGSDYSKLVYEQQQVAPPSRLVFRQVNMAYSPSSPPNQPSDYQPQFQHPSAQTVQGPRPSDSWRPIDLGSSMSSATSGGHQHYRQQPTYSRYRQQPSSTLYKAQPDHDVVSLGQQDQYSHRGNNTAYGYNSSAPTADYGYASQGDQAAQEYPRHLVNSTNSHQHKANIYSHTPQPVVYVTSNSLEQTGYNYENGSQPMAHHHHQYEQQHQSASNDHQYNVSSSFAELPAGAKHPHHSNGLDSDELPKIPHNLSAPRVKSKSNAYASSTIPVDEGYESEGTSDAEQATKQQNKSRPKLATSRRPQSGHASRGKKAQPSKAKIPQPAGDQHPELVSQLQQAQYTNTGGQSTLDMAVAAAADYQHQQQNHQPTQGESAEGLYSAQQAVGRQPQYGGSTPSLQHYNLRPIIGPHAGQQQLPAYYRPMPPMQPAGKSLLSWETISSVASGAAKRLPGALSSIFSPFAASAGLVKNQVYPTAQSANYHLVPMQTAQQQYVKSAHYSGDVANFHRPYPLRHMNAPETYSDLPTNSDVSITKYQAQDSGDNAGDESGGDEQAPSDDLGSSSSNDSEESSLSDQQAEEQSSSSESTRHSKAKSNSTSPSSGGGEIIADLAEISVPTSADPTHGADLTMPKAKPSKSRSKTAHKNNNKKAQLDSAHVAVLSSIEQQLASAGVATTSTATKTTKPVPGANRRRPKKKPAAGSDSAEVSDDSGLTIEPAILSSPLAGSSGDHLSTVGALGSSAAAAANGVPVNIDTLPADQQRLLLAAKSKPLASSSSGVMFGVDGAPLPNGVPFMGSSPALQSHYMHQMRPMTNMGALQPGGIMQQPINGLTSVKIGQFRITPQTQFVQSIIEPSRQMLGQYFKQYIGQLGQFG